MKPVKRSDLRKAVDLALGTTQADRAEAGAPAQGTSAEPERPVRILMAEDIEDNRRKARHFWISHCLAPLRLKTRRPAKQGALHNSTMTDDRIIVHVDPDLEAVIPRYLENKQKEVQTIRGALEKADFETIRILGHGMKGSGGGYGFDPITDIGASLERAAKENNSGEIQKSIDELLNYLRRIEIVYDQP